MPLHLESWTLIFEAYGFDMGESSREITEASDVLDARFRMLFVACVGP